MQLFHWQQDLYRYCNARDSVFWQSQQEVTWQHLCVPFLDCMLPVSWEVHSQQSTEQEGYCDFSVKEIECTYIYIQLVSSKLRSC